MRLADWIVAAGALALFVFLFFFDWFGGGVAGLPAGARISGTTIATTGWQTFTSSRWIWLATVLVALVSALATAAAYRLDGPVQLGALTAGFGAVSCVLIVYRIVHHPSATLSLGHLRSSYGIRFGIWLGLVAALAIAYGGYLQTREPEEPSEPAPAPAKPKEAFSGLALAPSGGQAPSEGDASERSAASGEAPASPRPPDDAP
ncbi:MAG TPA: hypothetical protein VGX69_07140 [Solirubrobacteraceae bacterium]|nr:hypothetical protein [Solirubrobacteraceae bacterium]